MHFKESEQVFGFLKHPSFLYIFFPLTPIRYHEKKANTIVPEWIRHKFYFYFYFFCICVKFLIKSKVQLLGFNHRLSNIESKRLKQSGHTRLFHTLEERLFIILYSYYLSKNLELKNQVLKFKFEI